MTTVRALADDLTGALDAGAAFAACCGPIPVHWLETSLPTCGSFVFDNETRDEADPIEAAARTQRQLGLLDGAETAFKKIDSLIRGHTIGELSACIDSGRVASVIVAPAFPAQGRVTRTGRQYARFLAGQQWTPVGPDLLAALGGASKSVRHVGPTDRASGPGVFVCDAVTESDLGSLRERLSGIERPILWCGSAGLARALAGPPNLLCVLRRGSVLAVIGSNHPLARRQVATVQAEMPSAVCTFGGKADCEQAVDFLSGRIQAGRPAVLAFDYPQMDATAARQQMADAIENLLPRLPRPDRCVVTGGETLMLVLHALGASSALVTGELMPGIAVGHVVGGIWDGVDCVSKSGAFGSPSTLLDLLVDTVAESAA